MGLLGKGVRTILEPFGVPQKCACVANVHEGGGQCLVSPLCNGEGHGLQPLLIGLRCADLGDHRAEQFVHQLQYLVSILFDIFKLRKESMK